MQYDYAQILDLIQYAIEEGTGEACSGDDAESIYVNWQATVAA
jgi:hypothetical protein